LLGKITEKLKCTGSDWTQQQNRSLVDADAWRITIPK